ncbi:hypothetical protein THICB1_70080 [Thiomonas arsenitoxydans]|uniref:Uncharacterized protein n=1 Tax=Thiomonas arsenitoxydans (strain DSM 22701 / CIP 110005 / 3As) TaxID=426114 RepID=A0ABM9T809_THIA3|nr:hypothetical protein THICB1_70080 [Thiomonas arsenitoxydans]CQR40453.1 hypothetical protein ACO7_630047 [Thiomonas arsenitoxydans]
MLRNEPSGSGLAPGIAHQTLGQVRRRRRTSGRFQWLALGAPCRRPVRWRLDFLLRPGLSHCFCGAPRRRPPTARHLAAVGYSWVETRAYPLLAIPPGFRADAGGNGFDDVSSYLSQVPQNLFKGCPAEAFWLPTLS